MPNLNGTGPRSQGVMTGKKLGKCNKPFANRKDNPDNITENNKETTDRFGRGRGSGYGFGRGRGRRNRFGYRGGKD